MEMFATISGYKNNTQKTKAMGLSTQAYEQSKVDNFLISVEPVTILGFEMEPNMNKMRAGNMNGKIAKMKKVLNPWYGKNVTAITRIRVAKTLALSILTYPIMNLAITRKELLEIEKIIYQFIWGGGEIRAGLKKLY